MVSGSYNLIDSSENSNNHQKFLLVEIACKWLRLANAVSAHSSVSFASCKVFFLGEREAGC